MIRINPDRSADTALKKAFDSIQHSLLWKKLYALGVSGQLIRVLQSMYAKATERVILTTSEATK